MAFMELFVFLQKNSRVKTEDMKRFTLLSIALIFIVNSAVCQKNITIKGTSENGRGRKVELTKYSDLISKTEVILDTARIGEDGTFDVRCYTNYPMLVTLQIENYAQSFYVEPAREYQVYIPRFDWNLDESRNVFFDPETLPLVFRNVPPNDINLQIDSIDRVISDFVEENSVYFDQRFRPTAAYFDSLVKVVNRKCPDGESEFVNRYKVYQLAEMKYALKFDSRKSLVERYIRNQPILYYDENYMSLFTTLYANSISKGTKDIPVYRLAHWVYNLDLDTYLDSIGMDPLLRHEQVRELAALQALQESYYNFRYYDAEMVVKMIEKLANRTKFPDHKIIAQHILDGIDQRDEGGRVMTFSLPDVEKNMVSLSDMKGKWVYIAFVRVNDAASLAEIETMAHFKDTVKMMNPNVEFVTIACDREFQKMFHFLKNSKHGDRYNWTWLHYNGNYDLLRHYQITSYPWFVLINPQGEIQYDITPAPSTGFLMNAPWINREDRNRHQRELFRY